MTDTTTKETHLQQTTTQQHQGQNAPPVVTIAYDHYAHYLENADLSEDEKRQLIETLWTIIVSLVDFGFGVIPASAPPEKQACGKLSENPPNIALMGPNALHCERNQTSKPQEKSTESSVSSVQEGAEA